jgi:hypothetical protein
MPSRGRLAAGFWMRRQEIPRIVVHGISHFNILEYRWACVRRRLAREEQPTNGNTASQTSHHRTLSETPPQSCVVKVTSTILYTLNHSG